VDNHWQLVQRVLTYLQPLVFSTIGAGTNNILLIGGELIGVW